MDNLDFAKLFGRGKDQILVVIEQNDETDDADAHRVKISYNTHHPDLAICSYSIEFGSEAAARKSFDAIDEKAASKATAAMRKQVHEMLGSRRK